MALLGFDVSRKVTATIPEHDFRVVEYSHPKLAFALSSPRRIFEDNDVHRRKPGSLHHLAFRADSRDEVDTLYHELIAIGAKIVTAPQEYPEYSPPGYYAVFFKDPDGIKYEIVHY
jgi:catechol 2,3-dioxygenase-like lactoylglutathione lyase family enzyme